MTEENKSVKNFPNLRNVPKLRFSQFTDPWENEKLGELMTFKVTNSYSRDNLNYESGTVKNIHYGDIHTKFQTLFDLEKENVPYINEDIPLSRISEDFYCQEGDIIFADASEDLNDVGKSIEVTNLNGEKLLSGLHTLLARPQKNIFFKGFLGYLLKSDSVRNQIKREAQGSKVLSINAGRISNIYLSFPSFSEQHKISECLSLMDKRIQTQKKIIGDLKLLKKEITKKIFNQKIKFKTCNQEEFPIWKLTKLENILIKYEERSTYSNQYPILTSARTGIYFQKDYFDDNEVASKDNTGYNIVPRGYFTYRHMSDDIVFKFNINNLCDKGIVSTLYPVFTTKGVNDYFLKEYLNEGQEFKNYALLQKQGGSRTYMYFNKLNKLALYFPCIQEQTKIAEFLSKFDAKINLENKLLTQYENQKKYLLQNLFV